MSRFRPTALALAACLLASLPALADTAKPKPSLTPKEILAASKPAEWRTPAPDNLLVMTLAGGHRVLIELAPDFTPLHAANIRTLAHEHYFDGLAIIRVQDNFVTQWGDPNDDDNADRSKMKPLGTAKRTLPPEFTRPLDRKLAFTRLSDGDVYAPEVGFSEGFPVARDPASHEEWITHCYGTVGVARDVPPTSGNGNSLYAIIGQAPRGLDRNLAVAGRVIEGMEYLSALPRGTGPLGFYEKAEQRTPIVSVRLAADLPPAERPKVEVLRTDSASFAKLIEAKRNRVDAFYTRPAGKIDLCSISVPTRDP
ncbi:MAG: peptidylprolyl isomerase [Lysobacterales bacterium 13-68-4]|jgi:peptidylprolyl isomerase|nr:MAG: peptidylprolyl isomerase [Xanthomonadales bacterium 15-68-25]OZB65652.1 MAG: peptidylprolyl isomerase [Xanthomonadales bacterium 14-68-21]OZB72070.1 MAG: peptidylprolyl isomerase [Xanthomonadales bacterium 13-68-4]